MHGQHVILWTFRHQYAWKVEGVTRQALGICPTRRVCDLFLGMVGESVLHLAHGSASWKLWKTQVKTATLSISVTYVRYSSQVPQRGVGPGWQTSINRLYIQVRAVKEDVLR